MHSTFSEKLIDDTLSSQDNLSLPNMLPSGLKGSNKIEMSNLDENESSASPVGKAKIPETSKLQLQQDTVLKSLTL